MKKTQRRELVEQRLIEALQLLVDKASAKGTDNDFATWHRCSAADIGEILTGARQALQYAANQFMGYDGKPYGIGDRVELSPHTDLWMRGARFGTVHSCSLTELDRVKVRMDHPAVKNLVAGTEDTFKRVQS